MISSITKRSLRRSPYADENKENIELIDAIIEKAKKRKRTLPPGGFRPAGLSHRGKNQEIYKLAEQIKKDFYGNRIVMFAPLYLSNYCINGCTYCPYHAKNKHIPRKAALPGRHPPGKSSPCRIWDTSASPGGRRGSGQKYNGLLSEIHRNHLQHQT